jgi:branched-chain amino acid transport system ATP-binding protein
LKEVRRDGLAILLVEQNFRFAAAIAHEIHMMQAGRIVHRSENPDESELGTLAERYLGVGAGAATV